MLFIVSFYFIKAISITLSEIPIVLLSANILILKFAKELKITFLDFCTSLDKFRINSQIIKYFLGLIFSHHI